MDLIAIILVVIALIGGGITTLRKGMIRATRYSVVEGPPARVIGWLLLLAIPLTFVSYWLLPGLLAALGEPMNPVGIGPLLAFCLPLVACPLIAVVIGFATAQREQREPAPSRPVPGSVGRAVSPLTPCGTIEVEGGCFPARSTQGAIAVGSRVVVVGFDPSWLVVEEGTCLAGRTPFSYIAAGRDRWQHGSVLSGFGRACSSEGVEGLCGQT